MIKNTKKLKGVSKAAVKNNIKHNDYVEVLIKKKPLAKEVIGIRSFGHEIYTFKKKQSSVNIIL